MPGMHTNGCPLLRMGDMLIQVICYLGIYFIYFERPSVNNGIVRILFLLCQNLFKMDPIWNKPYGFMGYP